MLRDKSTFKKMVWVAVPSTEIEVKQTENKFSGKKETSNHLKHNFSKGVYKENRFKENEIKIISY